nr:MAG TPA: protease [Caudoviricetes sp.]
MANRPYKNFVQKRRGKRVDYDKQYDHQCTDLAKQYIDEILGIKKI